MNPNKKLTLVTLCISVLAVVVIIALVYSGWRMLSPVFTRRYQDAIPMPGGTAAAQIEDPTPWPEYEVEILASPDMAIDRTQLAITNPVAHVSTTALNVRSGPGVIYQRIAVLANGSKLTIYACDSGWARLTTGNSARAEWVNADLLEPNPCTVRGK